MRILAGIGFVAVIVAACAAIFFFGGFFSVAANQPDLVAISWALEKIRNASIGHNRAP